MKTIFIAIILFLPGNFLFAQTDSSVYDKTLADSLGADDYGMKTYVLVILKKGPEVIEQKQKRDSLFKGHMENINRLVERGKLVVAGPLFQNEKEYRGIFILNVPTIEEAQDLIVTDPAIKAGVFDVDMFRWYGSAALPLYIKGHEKIEKKKH